MQKKFDLLIDSYIDSKVGQCKDFLHRELAKNLRARLWQLLEEDRLRRAGIGHAATLTKNLEIRSDKILWLDRQSADATELEFFDHMDQFVDYLNSTCFTGITGYEFHYAFYDKGTFYRRHLDQFRDDDARMFSMIMYLNENWQPGDGGELVIYHEDREQVVPPLDGTCVFFNSGDLEHEVLMSHKPRISVTGWLRRDTLL